LTEITRIGDKKYRYVDKESKDDFKFEVYESPLLESARESIINETIRMTLNLTPHDKIKILDDEDNK
jgi:hypothetical protein